MHDDLMVVSTVVLTVMVMMMVMMVVNDGYEDDNTDEIVMVACWRWMAVAIAVAEICSVSGLVVLLTIIARGLARPGTKAVSTSGLLAFQHAGCPPHSKPMMCMRFLRRLETASNVSSGSRRDADVMKLTTKHSAGATGSNPDPLLFPSGPEELPQAEGTA